MKPPNVVGVHEIAVMLGVSNQNAYYVTQHKTFPPARELGRGRVWDWKQVLTWLEKQGRTIERSIPWDD